MGTPRSQRRIQPTLPSRIYPLIRFIVNVSLNGPKPEAAGDSLADRRPKCLFVATEKSEHFVRVGKGNRVASVLNLSPDVVFPLQQVACPLDRSVRKTHAATSMFVDYTPARDNVFAPSTFQSDRHWPRCDQMSTSSLLKYSIGCVITGM